MEVSNIFTPPRVRRPRPPRADSAVFAYTGCPLLPLKFSYADSLAGVGVASWYDTFCETYPCFGHNVEYVALRPSI